MAFMRVSSRRRSVAVVIALGATLVSIAVALNVTWILLNWQKVALLILGLVFFAAIIAGVALNTVFLVREIRRNEQHDAFINAVSHELKTPIASIRLYLETLKTRDVDEAQRREFYDVMLADSQRLLGTVEQVLQAARAGHKGRRVRTRIVDVGELVKDCAETTRAHYNLDASALRYVESANGSARAAVRGDREELRAAVSNLLDNAVKYSPKEIDVTVSVEARDARTVAVRVSDRGVGIRPGQTRRIFNRFYRAPGRIAARVKGTGLGLFIVRSVVEQHGGRVFAESEGPGRGSTFTILLPRVAGEER